jgi:hypothetical protein
VPNRARSSSTAARSSGTERTTAGRGEDGWDSAWESVICDWRRMTDPHVTAGRAEPDSLQSPMRGTGLGAVIGWVNLDRGTGV